MANQGIKCPIHCPGRRIYYFDDLTVDEKYPDNLYGLYLLEIVIVRERLAAPNENIKKEMMET